MTKDMAAFLNELADLLEKHDVEMEALEATIGYDCYADGIEFTINSKWNDEGGLVREFIEVNVGRWPDPKWLRDIAEIHPVSTGSETK